MNFSMILNALSMFFVLTVCAFNGQKNINTDRRFPNYVKSTYRQDFSLAESQLQEDRSSPFRSLWRRSKKSVASLALAVALFQALPMSPALAVVAKEKVDVSARANDILIESLRPGATSEDAEAALNPEILVREKEEVNKALPKVEEKSQPNNSKKKSKKPAKQLYYDDEDDDDELDEVEAQFFEETSRASISEATNTKTATTSNIYVQSTKITTATYAKAAMLFLTAPVLLFGGIETYKRRSESAYVKKALQIQAMKREEYLNKTAAETGKMGNNSTSTTDDDDDDDDDDDNDDDDDDIVENKSPPSKPKKPNGGKDSGGGSGSTPSADDIDRLNKLMGKK
jgi:hypothetical protein